MAWKITDESTLLFFNGRKALHAVKQSVRRSFKEDNDGDDLISIRFDDNVSLSGILSGENSTHAPHVLHISVDLAHIKEEATRESVLSYVLPYEKECSSPRITHNTTHNTLTLSLPISAVHLVTLFERYKRSREGDVAEGPFLARLAILLIRYSGLCGGDMEKESGWHAAVPPSILHTYTSCYTISDRVSNSIPVECFASPFNATLDHFFSVFPDTDKWFGSLGNFFATSALKQFIDATRVRSDADHKIVHYGLEANPPFDHEVIQACVFQALALLEGESSVALSILLVLPDSTQEIAKKVREPAENSVYCQANRSLPAEECAYVHGAQHQAQTTAGSRKRSRDGDTATVALTAAREDYASQVKLKCPTRLILLQNEKCNTIMAGKDVMQTIQEKWLAFSK
ncbi:hypothetical protein AGDE_08890 [Angomonas deanei]|nr:hypothetical protein AGDE_08890 [Angomonas deanei]|eukprot:EPY32052.1 hypothetical protein AGDE_08890 [Angomonas deanei]